jgi:bifunctional UDP-N-acetylglucosamine pyrophosphorylase/glucosamine-1-phosphate N-acetyltransferase
LNGDNLYDAVGLVELFETGPAVGTITVDDPRAYGVLELDGDRVLDVTEKPANPPSQHINTGAYVFPADALDWLEVGRSERGELELTDVLARACRERRLRAVTFDRWLDVGRPWELLEANEWKLGELERSIEGEVHRSAELDGKVVVAPGATIRSGAVLEGPVHVGPGATVGPNAYLRGATALGPDVKVGHAVEVKNSLLMNGTHVSHLSYVGDSVLGRNANFGAGTQVANLRHDDSAVKVTVKGERVSTNRRKFGVVVGDGAKTAINTSLNAGVVLSTKARTHPGEAVLKDR